MILEFDETGVQAWVTWREGDYMRITPLQGSALDSIEVKVANGQTFYETIKPEVGLVCYAIDVRNNRVTLGIIGEKNTFGYMVEFEDGIRECSRFYKKVVI